ncbi:hypothetical protein FOYG_09429 [Fusarium oxysporum NRRL 32931]|uniref:Uncharacterized protein n=1 Tax=Fusarium oxysporum NRRL 32931 TaxID=660029 RepID=W9I6F0_FUSOX|nr:hypothetical protein FOYG_09429 [Fusarium oxysporum NRRL 32931]
MITTLLGMGKLAPKEGCITFLPMNCHTGTCSFVEVDDHYEPPAVEEDNALRNLADMIEVQLSHLRYFASLSPSGYNPKCIYRDEEYENINEIFPNHYGATVSFLKSLVIDMMRHLRQLDEIRIFPNGHHFYRGQ